MSLEKLAIKQYEIRQEQIRLKELKTKELGSCLLYGVEYTSESYYPISTKERIEHLEVMKEFTSLKPSHDNNCYSVIMEGLKDCDFDYDGGFEEALANYGCEHCNNARKLKRELGVAGVRLGQIRGQITRYGKRLSGV